MRIVGRRSLPQLSPRPSATLMHEASAINEPLAALLPDGLTAVPKGIYRYRTLDEADAQLRQWIAESMARAHAVRSG